jgi:SAM-dependent methyltransferase
MLNKFRELLTSIAASQADIQSRLASLERLSAQHAPIESSAKMALKTAGLCARSGANQFWNAEPTDTSYAPANALEIGSYLEKLERLNPKLFPIWYQLFENGRRSYFDQKEASCSTWNHEYALLFRDYVSIYGQGRTLDIGCGPHGDPVYLSGRLPGLVSAIEPLTLVKPASFEVVQGFCEFLPWPDKSFHTAISSTSLDHVLSLRCSLQEIQRVLVPGGRILVWLASIPGAEIYDESSAEQLDDYHLFHFCRTWCDEVFEQYFSIGDLTVLPVPGFDHVFYNLVNTKSGV